MTMRSFYAFIFFVACCALAANTQGEQPAVQPKKKVQVVGPEQGRIVAKTRFERKNTPAGDIYLYHLTFKGTQAEFKGQLPDVEGLLLKFKRAERSFKNINGKFESEVNFVYLAHRLEEKDFLVPAFEVQVDGESVVVPQARLLAQDRDEQKESARTVWMELTPMAKKVYVGQVLPFEVRLYRRSDIGLSADLAGPELKNEGFSLPLYEGRYEEDQTHIKGVGFSVYTWKGAMTALKSGTHSIQLNFPVVAVLPGASRDPFDIFMGLGGSQKHDLIMQTAPQDWEVQALPQEGRPKSFSGAVGSFTLDTELETQQLRKGEPVTLQLAISGTGALNQLVAPDLGLGPTWKQYPPKSELRSENPTNTQGTLLFEYILVPLDASAKSLPELRWAYFDPEQGRYEEVVLPSIAVTIEAPVDAPSAVLVKPEPAPSAASSPFEAPASTHAVASGPTLLPIHLDLGPQLDQLKPWALRPYFWLIQAGLLFLVGLVYMSLVRYRRLHGDSEYVRKHKNKAALQRHQKELSEAFRAQDMERFFDLACKVLREGVSLKTSAAPQALMLDDILRHSRQLGLSSDLQGTIKLCFHQADGAKYGASAVARQDLHVCYNHLKTIIAAFGA